MIVLWVVILNMMLCQNLPLPSLPPGTPPPHHAHPHTAHATLISIAMCRADSHTSFHNAPFHLPVFPPPTSYPDKIHLTHYTLLTTPSYRPPNSTHTLSILHIPRFSKITSFPPSSSHFFSPNQIHQKSYNGKGKIYSTPCYQM